MAPTSPREFPNDTLPACSPLTFHFLPSMLNVCGENQISYPFDGAPQDGWHAPNLDLLVGQPEEFQASLSGRAGGMAWRYFWLAPVGFQESLALTATTEELGSRLALFYVEGQ